MATFTKKEKKKKIENKNSSATERRNSLGI